MSLPPGFLDELRSRASLSQVVGRKVVWDTRKSNQGKGSGRGSSCCGGQRLMLA